MILKIFWSKKNKVISYVCVFVGGGGGTGRGKASKFSPADSTVSKFTSVGSNYIATIHKQRRLDKYPLNETFLCVLRFFTLSLVKPTPISENN